MNANGFPVRIAAGALIIKTAKRVISGMDFALIQGEREKMSHPKQAWYPYMKNIARRYPNNLNPDENAAVKAALDSATIGEMQPDPRDHLGEVERRIYLEQLQQQLNKAIAQLPEDQQ